MFLIGTLYKPAIRPISSPTCSAGKSKATAAVAETFAIASRFSLPWIPARAWASTRAANSVVAIGISLLAALIAAANS